MNYNELTHLGLSEKEAKVYLAALELGKTSVQNISKKAEVNRATTYVIIESLIKKGLMSSIEESKKQFFYAEPPEKLRMLFESMETEIVRKLDYLDKMLPELRALSAKENVRPSIKYYEGKEGLRAIHKELSNQKSGTSRMIYSWDMLKDLIGAAEKGQFPDKGKPAGVKTKTLYAYRAGTLESTADGEKKKIPVDKFPINAEIAIFGSKVSIASLGNKIFGMIIEDNDLAEAFASLFELAWRGTENEK